ncbi:MAG: histone-like nucleoid-structuring protein Lsr2 [Propionibacteriaceae bacterium]
MAQRVNVMLIDDVDGSPADETVSFALDGVQYEMDLTKENAEILRVSFGEWVSKARRVGGRKNSGKAVRFAARDNNEEIRTWARDNGHDVKERGRIPLSLIQAYDAAH